MKEKDRLAVTIEAGLSFRFLKKTLKFCTALALFGAVRSGTITGMFTFG